MKPYEMAFMFLIFFIAINLFRLFEIFMAEYCGSKRGGSKWEK